MPIHSILTHAQSQPSLLRFALRVRDSGCPKKPRPQRSTKATRTSWWRTWTASARARACATRWALRAFRPSSLSAWRWGKGKLGPGFPWCLQGIWQANSRLPFTAMSFAYCMASSPKGKTSSLRCRSFKEDALLEVLDGILVYFADVMRPCLKTKRIAQCQGTSRFGGLNHVGQLSLSSLWQGICVCR